MTKIENAAKLLGYHVIEKCEEYVCLGDTNNLGKENQTWAPLNE